MTPDGIECLVTRVRRLITSEQLKSTAPPNLTRPHQKTASKTFRAMTMPMMIGARRCLVGEKIALKNGRLGMKNLARSSNLHKRPDVTFSGRDS